MSYTVEKIGGTSMTAFDAVLDNIILKPSNPYQRVFVVSAYGGMTDALLECKRTGKPGVYQKIAQGESDWPKALNELEQRMLLINEQQFADPMVRLEADEFIQTRLSQAKSCIESILKACEFGQFVQADYLPDLREFLASLGEAHSAFNTALKLNNIGINARFVDLSGWNTAEPLPLDEVIDNAFEGIDIAQELPIVTGYAYCQEGLMKTYDRGYSEMTFSRIAVRIGAQSAIIHKEYHLSSADPRIVGPERVHPMGVTNYDVAAELARLGMEAIHPNAAAGLKDQGITLYVKNTFEPDHAGSCIADVQAPDSARVEIVAGKAKAFALHLAEVTSQSNFSQQFERQLTALQIRSIGQESDGCGMTVYLHGKSDQMDRLVKQLQASSPELAITLRTVALVAAIGAHIDCADVVSRGVKALVANDIDVLSVQAKLDDITVQYAIAEQDYAAAVCTLHQALIESSTVQEGRQVTQAA